MVHTCWCLEHNRTKAHLSNIWISLWIHMALTSVLILTQGLNWLSSSLALIGLGWTSTSCSRKLAYCSTHPCSLTGSACTLIQTLGCVIWGLEGGLHPHWRPFGVDRKNDLVPDYPLGCCLHHQGHACELQSFQVWVIVTLKASHDAEEMETVMAGGLSRVISIIYSWG